MYTYSTYCPAAVRAVAALALVRGVARRGEAVGGTKVDALVPFRAGRLSSPRIHCATRSCQQSLRFNSGDRPPLDDTNPIHSCAMRCERVGKRVG